MKTLLNLTTKTLIEKNLGILQELSELNFNNLIRPLEKSLIFFQSKFLYTTFFELTVL
jgi:hypothetical protein